MPGPGLPAEPLKFLVEMALFWVLLVPGVLLAGLRKLLPAKRKSVAGQVVLVSNGVGRNKICYLTESGSTSTDGCCT